MYKTKRYHFSLFFGHQLSMKFTRNPSTLIVLYLKIVKLHKNCVAFSVGNSFSEGYLHVFMIVYAVRDPSV